MEYRRLAIFLLFALVLPQVGVAQKNAQSVLPETRIINVDGKGEMQRLLKFADADNDKKITIDDLSRPGPAKPGSRFWLEDRAKNKYEVSGIYFLSNLLQELKLQELKVLSETSSDSAASAASTANAAGSTKTAIRADRIFENPVARVSRSIRETYWDSLTRRVDVANLSQVLPDSKVATGEWHHLYVPERDAVAVEYFERAAREKPQLKMKVWRLPENLSNDFMNELSGRHGILSLGLEKTPSGALVGLPFVVPGGRFNEMYGWDSYFEALGLLADNRIDLARSMVDNFVYEIEYYGKILNANRTYYLNRSQPPFMTSMISAVYEKLEKNEASRAWLSRALKAAIKEYKTVWMNPERLTDTGLSRYYGNGRGIPPEVEPGHFNYVLSGPAAQAQLTIEEFSKRYNSGAIKDTQLDDFFAQDRAVRESGHDTTFRWRVNGVDRAADFVTVDLNSLLYKYELDIARLLPTARLEKSFSQNRDYDRNHWKQLARKRKELMRKYLWDDQKQMFFDYNFKDRVRSSYVSATGFYPLWAIDPSDRSSMILSAAEASATQRALLRVLEMPGGLAATSPESLEKSDDKSGGGKQSRQWEYPNGWAPHQMIAWSALKNHGNKVDANRLIYKWLYTIARNAADYNGTVPEKFDVVARSHAVFAEYGNVGTQFSYITTEGFGWMNASFQVGLQQLSPDLKPSLENLTPPEWMAFERR